MSFRTLLAFVAIVVAASGCRAKQAEPSELASRAATADALPAEPAPSVSKMFAELATQLHLPSRQASGTRVPLLIMLHGLGSSSETIERYSDWPAFAEQAGVAWAAPDGPFDRRGRRFWDAGPSCCNFDRVPVDHVAALGALIERFGSEPRIDRARVFVGGYSNGGFMAHRLACERPELVAGIVSIAGSGPLDGSGCRTPKSLRVLQVQGDADPIVTYAGGHLFQDPRLPEHASAQQTLRDWAGRLGCVGEPRALAPLDLESKLPGEETRVSSYEGCAQGSVALWTVRGGQHMIGFSAPAPSAIWSFLSR